ncbi:MAG TPA: prolipoprotein diacylglyceryl transferase, partial [Bdellovibrionota bacterium]
LLGRWLARSRGLNPAPFMDLALVAIMSGIVGARMFFVLSNLDYYRQHPGEMADFWNGGLVFYGGLILGTVACLAYGIWRRMPLWLSTDIVLAGVTLAHAFGRIGCFAAGCCHGNYCPYPWAVRPQSEFVEDPFKGQPVHPVQLYESFSLFFLAGLMVWLVREKKLRDGAATILYCLGYGIIRFVMEAFRGDESRGFVLGHWLSTSQSIALGLFLLGCGILVGRFRRKNL